MSSLARDSRAARPRLTIVRGTRAPLQPAADADWRRLAQAVLACTHELAQHLVEHRWGRVDEALRERRELLAGLARLSLDVDGSRCLRALTAAVEESESAIAVMVRTRRAHR